MSVWTEVVLPIFAGPILVAGKYVWDLYYDREQDILRRKHEKQLESWETYVKDFYWPLYLGLIENQAIWKFAMEQQLVLGETICKSDETDSSESEGERQTPPTHKKRLSTVVPVRFNTTRCAYRYNTGVQCGVPLSKHQKQLFGSFCMAHYILQYDFNQVSTVSWKDRNMVVSKDSSLQEHTEHSTQEKIQYILQELKQNHEKLSDIIQHHLPVISSRSRLGKYMIQFQQYIQAFELVNLTKDPNGIKNPKLQGGIYPKRILPYLEQELFYTQKMLYERTENFYKEIEKGTQKPKQRWCSLCCGCGSAC